MLTPNERAIELYNRAIKTCVHLSCDMRKAEAQHICLANIISIKEAIFDLTTIDDVPVNQVKKTLEYYNEIKKIIEEI